MMDKQQTIRRMIEKECQRDGLKELCEYWGVTCDDFYAFLDDACRAPDIVYCRECQYYRDLMCWHHTEPCTNAKGYKGEVVCVEPGDSCSHGVRSKP